MISEADLEACLSVNESPKSSSKTDDASEKLNYASLASQLE